MSAETTTQQAAPLRFTRTVDGYRAVGAEHIYRVHRRLVDGKWSLSIYTVHRVVGLTLTDEQVSLDFHDLLRLAKATANAYEALGEDYSTADHGGRNRLTVAIDHAYAADAAH